MRTKLLPRVAPALRRPKVIRDAAAGDHDLVLAHSDQTCRIACGRLRDAEHPVGLPDQLGSRPVGAPDRRIRHLLVLEHRRDHVVERDVERLAAPVLRPEPVERGRLERGRNVVDGVGR